MSSRIAYVIALLVGALVIGACAQHYVTPGGGVPMLALAGDELTDRDLRKYYETQPAAGFPANLTVIRIQDSGYRSHTHHGYGYGRFTIVTTRDIEDDEAFEKLESLPNVRGVAAIGRMLVPANSNTIRDLRVPAARLHADMILVYSVDTSFTVDGKQLGPLSLVSLGLIPNKKAHVTATVAGMLVDVRTGYIYGTAESTNVQKQSATIWSTEMAIDTARRKAEITAFDGFVDEFADMWGGVVSAYAHRRTPTPQDDGASRPGYHSVLFED